MALHRAPVDRGTEAAGRVADVLMLFTSGPASLGVSEIARELDLSKAVVHRILQSLASREIVASDPITRDYRLGRAAVALGARAMRDFDMRRAAQPVLRRLREETSETTTLSELIGHTRVYLDQFEGPQQVRVVVEVGRPHELHAGASGKAMLAFLPDETQARLLAGPLESITAATTTDPDDLRAQLADIRSKGYAVSLAERQDRVASIAAPVFGLGGEVIGSISVCGPIDRFDHETIDRHAPRVIDAARDVSIALGWTHLPRDMPSPAGVASSRATR